MAHETSISPVASPTPAYRFVDLELNRKHYSSDSELTVPRRTTANDAEANPPVSPRPRYIKFLEAEGPSKSKELMVPEEMQSPKPILYSQPHNGIKKSKYTTDILTTSGWQPINNPFTKAADIETLPESVAPAWIVETEVEEVPDEEGSVIDFTYDREEDEELRAETGTRRVPCISAGEVCRPQRTPQLPQSH
jgi:hypothetical protein